MRGQARVTRRVVVETRLAEADESGSVGTKDALARIRTKEIVIAFYKISNSTIRIVLVPVMCNSIVLTNKKGCCAFMLLTGLNSRFLAGERGGEQDPLEQELDFAGNLFFL
jgi:hypothetical protein